MELYTFEWLGREVTCIAKSHLIVGRTYSGRCRNSFKAVWNGNQFVYDRESFGDTYKEGINHPEDFNGYDVFIPTKLLED